MGLSGADGEARDAGPRTLDGRLRLPWLDPDDRTWAVAVSQRGPDGLRRDARDRRGRLKINEVDLIRAVSSAAERESEAVPGASDLEPAKERWLLNATTRGWPAIRSTFGVQSQSVALRLVARGVVELRVPVVGAVLDLEHPRAWRLTDAWRALAAQAAQSRAASRSNAAEEAHAAAELVNDLDPALAEALRSAPDHWTFLPVLVAAAHDLASGVRHDGPRAFSQIHFGDSKVRDDAPDILREAGASEESIDLLGLRRSPYVGFGGPITVAGLLTSSVPGPVRFRADPHRPLAVSLAPAATELLLVENLQAAEAVCDGRPDVATGWFAGQPADTVLETCVTMARQAGDRGLRVLVAPDADLGGAHIANRLLKALPATLDLTIVDVGSVAHPPGSDFSVRTVAHLERLHGRAEQGGAGPYSPALAEYVTALLRRGHAVEQEATIRAAIDQSLSG